MTSQEHCDRLEEAEQSATAELAALNAELRREVSQRETTEQEKLAIAHLTARLAAASTVEAVVDVLCEESRQLLGWDFFYVADRRDGDGVFRLVYLIDTVQGRVSKMAAGESAPLDFSPALHSVIEGEPLLIDRSPDHMGPQLQVVGEPSASLMFVPIRSGDHVVGVISAQSYTFHRYTRTDLLLLLQLAEAVAPALVRTHAEEALRESEERYRFLTEYVTDVIWRMDSQLRLTYVSPAVARVIGYTAEEMTRLKLDEILTPASRDVVARAVSEELESARSERNVLSRSFHLELDVIRKDGSTVWLEVNATSLRSPQGVPRELVGVARDVTERRRIAHELAVRNRELLTLKTISDLAMAADSLDEAYRRIVTEVSLTTGFPVVTIELHDAARRMMVLRAWTGMPLDVEAGVFEVPEDRTLSGIVVRTGKPLIEMDALRRPECGDSSLRRAGISVFVGVPMKVGGRVLGVISLGHAEQVPVEDRLVEWATNLASHMALLTERKRAQEALRDERNLVTTILDTAAALIVVFDDQGRIARLNRACENLTGRSFGEMVGRAFWEVLVVPEEADAVKAIFERLVNGEGSGECENHWLTRDGEPRLIAWTSSVLRSDDDRTKYVVGTGIDITERRHAEEEREKIQAQLYQSQKLESIGVLAGGIAHDFNNLLAVICGNAQHLLQTRRLPKAEADALNDIVAAANNAAEMTSALQAFSRPARPQIRHIDANEIVEQVYRLLRRMIPVTIEFRLDLASEACPVEVDPAQMQQVLVNLCVNARDAMPSGGKLQIETRHLAPGSPLPQHLSLGESEPGYVRIAVSDTGHAMDADTLRRAFDPFFTTKPKDRGTGLGLAIVHNVVLAHDGVIDLDSQPGQGTRFSIYFPAARGEPKGAEPIDEGLLAGREHIMVVDDEELVASLLRTVLESRGYTVTVANQPEEAIRMASTDGGLPDLVIVDYSMPGMTGDRCLLELRRKKPDLKAIIVTGYGPEEAQVDELNCEVVRKPFAVTSLVRTVRKILDED